MLRHQVDLTGMELYLGSECHWVFVGIADMQSLKNHGLEISQPGLEPGQGLTWEMTKH